MRPRPAEMLWKRGPSDCCRPDPSWKDSAILITSPMLTDTCPWQVLFLQMRKWRPERWGSLFKVTQPGKETELDFESSAPFLASHARPGAKHHEDRALRLLPPPPGVCVPALPCRSQEADEKGEELETGPEGFSLNGTQLDKPDARRCQRLHPSTPRGCLLPASPHAGAISTQSCLGLVPACGAPCLVGRQGNRPLQRKGEVLGWSVPNKS